jgi:hypothetical protein
VTDPRPLVLLVLLAAIAGGVLLGVELFGALSG